MNQGNPTVQEIVQEAETMLLSAIFIRNKIFFDLNIFPDDFSDPRNQVLFSALGEIISGGKKADMVVVTEAMQVAGKLGCCGCNINYIAYVVKASPTAEMYSQHQDIIIKAAKRRKLKLLGDELKELSEGLAEIN